MLNRLPELCLDRIATYLANTALSNETDDPSNQLPSRFRFILRNDDDVTKDVLALCLVSLDVRGQLAERVAEKTDPLTREEMAFRMVSRDTDMQSAHSHHHVHSMHLLREACRFLNEPVSNSKSELMRVIERRRLKWIAIDGNRRDTMSGLRHKRIKRARCFFEHWKTLPHGLILDAYALHPEDLRTLPSPISRHRALHLALARHGDMTNIVYVVRDREQSRIATKKDRRKLLADSLRKRHNDLRPRSDSSLCTQFIEGRAGGPSLEEVVDVMEEMHFLYNCTDYWSILRALRCEDTMAKYRKSYWSREDMIRAGYNPVAFLSGEDSDDDIHDEDILHESEMEEADRRERAKLAALLKWKAQTLHPKDDHFEHLPVLSKKRLMNIAICQS